MILVFALVMMMLVAAGSPLATQPPQAPPAATAPATQVPATQVPAVPAAPTQVAPPPGGQPPASARQFSAPVGLLFNTVRADRVADFEKVIAYLQAALAKSTDSTIAAQAKGWRVYRSTEPGPNGSVLFVYVIDPTVPGADYSLGRILADAFPERAQLEPIWKLYTSSVTGGGTLLNLTPSNPPLPPAGPGVPAPTADTPGGAPRPVPPDANPNLAPASPPATP